MHPQLVAPECTSREKAVVSTAVFKRWPVGSILSKEEKGLQRRLKSSVLNHPPWGDLKYFCPTRAFKLKPSKCLLSVFLSPHTHHSQVLMGKPHEVTSGPVALGALHTLASLGPQAPHLSRKPGSQIPVIADGRGPPHLRKDLAHRQKAVSPIQE